MLIKPIKALKSQMQKIQNGQNDVKLCQIGTAEIAELSNQFNQMVEYVRNTEHELEEKIKQRTASIAQSEQKFRALFDSTQDAVMLLDEKGFFECNLATLNIFECSDFETFYTLHPSDLSPPLQPDGTSSTQMSNQYIQNAITSGSAHFEWIHKRYNSNESFHADVTLNAVVIDNKKVLQAMVRDISQRKQDEAEIHQLAFYDPLTHLPNRRLLNERVLHAIEMCKRDEEKYALLFFDLDNFKPLNDKYGHDAGDLLLIEVGKRLKECVRESDTVARFGGDEFVILLEKLGNDKQTATAHVDFVAKKLLQAVANEYVLTNNSATVTHYCSVSIGIDIFDSSRTSMDTIFKNADLAMYKAKEMGRNRVIFFEDIEQVI
jgi:diguanylate cyclase (GGDEF)-like protein